MRYKIYYYYYYLLWLVVKTLESYSFAVFWLWRNKNPDFENYSSEGLFCDRDMGNGDNATLGWSGFSWSKYTFHSQSFQKVPNPQARKDPFLKDDGVCGKKGSFLSLVPGGPETDLRAGSGLCGTWPCGCAHEQAAPTISGSWGWWGCNACRASRLKGAHFRPPSKWRGMETTLRQRESSVPTMSLVREHRQQSRGSWAEENEVIFAEVARPKNWRECSRAHLRQNRRKCQEGTGWWAMGARMEP